ncbi:hypothetical protein STEG23_001121 [Scotinomys teguina]
MKTEQRIWQMLEEYETLNMHVGVVGKLYWGTQYITTVETLKTNICVEQIGLCSCFSYTYLPAAMLPAMTVTDSPSETVNPK